jgi:hypothetical protein
MEYVNGKGVFHTQKYLYYTLVYYAAGKAQLV